jgi:predicted dinucleotide-binding enzyme
MDMDIDMDIRIIGSGHIGGTLARHLATREHRVSIANSRDPASLTEMATNEAARHTSPGTARGKRRRS